eukprot:PITA_08647
MCAHLAPLFPIVTIGPFTKWDIDFTTCNRPSVVNHKYIIVAIDYFTKWAEAMPTYKNDSETVTLFLFNQIISRFVKTATGFTPFQLVYGLESIFPVECESPSLKLVVELLPGTSSLEECLLHLEHLNEQRRDAATINEAHKKRVKTQYDRAVCARVFSEGDLVLVYEQDKDALGAGKFKFMWYGPFIVKRVLEKGAYELVDFEGNKLAEPRNGLYLKKYFA